jgi:hypothetical protein
MSTEQFLLEYVVNPLQAYFDAVRNSDCDIHEVQLYVATITRMQFSLIMSSRCGKTRPMHTALYKEILKKRSRDSPDPVKLSPGEVTGPPHPPAISLSISLAVLDQITPVPANDEIKMITNWLQECEIIHGYLVRNLMGWVVEYVL